MTAKIEKIEEILEYIAAHPEEENIHKSRLIEEHFAFIIHTVTQVTGCYVEIENSEELSIGLMAFDEAMSKYNGERGATFLTYARLVITSRVKDWIKKERHRSKTISLDQMAEAKGDKYGITDSDSENELALEIERWEYFLKKFGFDLDQLVDEIPKHVDTRNNAIDLSEKISGDDEIIHHMYKKYKLPLAKIILRFRTTKKIINRSKKFIIATIVILTKNLCLLKQWVYGNRKRCSS